MCYDELLGRIAMCRCLHHHRHRVSRCSLASGEACLRSVQLIVDCPVFSSHLCSHCFPPVCCLIGVASYRLSTAIDYESTCFILSIPLDTSHCDHCFPGLNLCACTRSLHAAFDTIPMRNLQLAGRRSQHTRSKALQTSTALNHINHSRKF
jgi:hypothetical protein